MPTKVVFLDRDGTINVDRGYVYRIDDWQLLEGSIEALGRLKKLGFRLAVVTNQSGIGRGYYRMSDVDQLHQHFAQLLAGEGLALDAVALCPHDPNQECDCRKPRTGMAREIERQLGEPIDYTHSWTVGDKISDAEFGRAIGTRVALIRSNYWDESTLSFKPDRIVTSLLEFACGIDSA